MKLKIMTDETTGESYIDFNEIAHLFDDPDSVSHYKLEMSEDDSIVLQFFDNNNNVIIPKDS